MFALPERRVGLQVVHDLGHGRESFGAMTALCGYKYDRLALGDDADAMNDEQRGQAMTLRHLVREARHFRAGEARIVIEF